MNRKKKTIHLAIDAKSTLDEKILSQRLDYSSAIKRHQLDYGAQFSVVVAIDLEGADDPESAVSKEAIEQKVTVMRAKDLMRLLLLWAPHQIGLLKLRNLFETCHAPPEK